MAASRGLLSNSAGQLPHARRNSPRLKYPLFQGVGQLRNLLSLVPKRGQSVVAAWVRTIFAQPEQGAARKQLRQVAATFAKKLPRAAELLLEAEEDVLAYMAFPSSH